MFADGIYYMGRPGPDGRCPFQFDDFSKGSSRLLAEVEGPLTQFLSVSPDRRTFLFTRRATRGFDLMLLEHFR